MAPTTAGAPRRARVLLAGVVLCAQARPDRAALADAPSSAPIPSYRLYVTTSLRTVESARASLETWNSPPSSRVFYMLGREARGQVESALAAAEPSQLVFLAVGDQEPARKDLAIWGYAFANHYAAGTDRAAPSWFGRVDDDCYVVVPRLEGLLAALPDGHAERVVAGTLFWIPGAPGHNRHTRALDWTGHKVSFDDRGRALPWPGRQVRFAVGRGEILYYPAGGVGTLVSSVALAHARGFEPACARTYARLNATGCPAHAVAGWKRDGFAETPGSGMLGHGEEGSFLHRLMCLSRYKSLPRVRSAANRTRPGRALRRSTGPKPPPDEKLRGRFTDAFFGYCVQQLHGLRTRHVGWLPRSSKLQYDLLLQGGQKRVLRAKQRDAAPDTLPPWMVALHGIKGAHEMRAAHRAFVRALSGANGTEQLGNRSLLGTARPSERGAAEEAAGSAQPAESTGDIPGATALIRSAAGALPGPAHGRVMLNPAPFELANPLLATPMYYQAS